MVWAPVITLSLQPVSLGLCTVFTAQDKLLAGQQYSAMRRVSEKSGCWVTGNRKKSLKVVSTHIWFLLHSKKLAGATGEMLGDTN